MRADLTRRPAAGQGPRVGAVACAGRSLQLRLARRRRTLSGLENVPRAERSAVMIAIIGRTGSGARSLLQ